MLEVQLGKREQRDGTQYAHIEALGASFRRDCLQDPSHDSVSHQHNLRAVCMPLFGAHLEPLRELILCLHVVLMRFQLIAIQMQ